jgi:hypothetical protein
MCVMCFRQYKRLVNLKLHMKKCTSAE